MSVFVDTSAFLALLDADDRHHARAARAWRRALDEDAELVTSSYVLVELYALVQARLGTKAVGALTHSVLPPVRVLWVDAELHAAAVASILAASRRKLGLVDCASFALMQRDAIEDAFAFDRHFKEFGFRPYF